MLSYPENWDHKESGPCTLTSPQLSWSMSEAETGVHSKAVSES